MKSLQNKVVVVTGAGSGIGRAIALNVAAKGALLAVCDLNEVGLQETADRLRAAGVRDLHTARLDVADKHAFCDYARSVKDHFDRVNVIVNNAGVSHSGPVLESSYEDFEWIMAINFWGVVYGTKEFLPHLIESGDGHVVNISSLFGLISMPGQSTYNAAKYAVRGFTESLREDMLLAGHPVGVTCVHPGGIKTGIARNGRVTSGQNHEELAREFDTKLARMTPDKAADIIVAGVLKDKARVLVGIDAHVVHTVGKLLGSRYQDLFVKAYERQMG